MDSLVRRLAAKGVEGRQRGWLWYAPQHVSSRTLAREPHVLEGRRAQQFCDQFQLLHRTLCLKKYPPTKELAKNATDTPNVHGCGIVSRSHQDFRCTIILRHHFLRHVLVLIGFFHSGQTEVADL